MPEDAQKSKNCIFWVTYRGGFDKVEKYPTKQETGLYQIEFKVSLILSNQKMLHRLHPQIDVYTKNYMKTYIIKIEAHIRHDVNRWYISGHSQSPCLGQQPLPVSVV